MKAISLLFFTFFLISCGIETKTINGVIYRSDFYNSSEISPRLNLTYIGDPYTVKGFDFFSRVSHEQFDLLYGYNGGPAWGDGFRMLYINECQWKIAQSYYANSDNFVYSCDIYGSGSSLHPFRATVTDIVPSNFDKLMTFAKKNELTGIANYQDLNKSIKIRRFIILEPWNTLLQYTFHKESRDGIFDSHRYSFYIIEKKLLFRLNYDNDNHEMIVVDVPNDVGQYFVELLAQFSSYSHSLVETIKS